MDLLDLGTPSPLFDRLFRINAECNRSGEQEASYHLLTAAMLVADHDENITNLDRVMALAHQQSDAIERLKPTHAMAKASAEPTGAPSSYDLLMTRATAARAVAVTHAFQRRMEAAQQTVPGELLHGTTAPPASEPPTGLVAAPSLQDREASRTGRLIELAKECFGDRVFEASYHVLMSAVFTAETAGRISDLDTVTHVAVHQAYSIESIVPPHRLSRAAAAGRRSPSLYDLLIRRSEAARNRLTILKFRRPAQAAEPDTQTGETGTG